MKILFDQGTPVPLRRFLADHSIDTAFERGWGTLENGQLLGASETDDYEILITTDQNLRYQQNIQDRKIAIKDRYNCPQIYVLAANTKTRGNHRENSR